MKAIQFSNKGQKWEVVEIKEYSTNLVTQLGWTHFAAIKRPNGKKLYYANLLIVDGEVVNTTVVL